MLDRILLGKLTPFFRDTINTNTTVISLLSPPFRGKIATSPIVSAVTSSIGRQATDHRLPAVV